jgi:ABC-type Fe3+-hydroxamate transport system substrate-binding protein
MEFPRTFTDQMQQQVLLASPPKRIISLVPSQTELMAHLGLDEQVVGITKFCIHPDEWFRSKTRVGGTKQYHFDKIAQLEPDLIIGNKEENDESQIRELQSRYPVWMSDIHNLEEALQMITGIGSLTSREEKATTLVRKISSAFAQLDTEIAERRTLSAAYLIWKNPYMAAGRTTFIDAMLQRLHLRSVFAAGRYPETTLEEMKALSPEVVLLSSEPYPFKEQHIREIQNALPQSAVLLVDGELFSWYGSRLLHAPPYFRQLLQQIDRMRSTDEAGRI